ncbi:MAG: tRNA (adenine-N1)-methyltransferase [Candidatus Helarchaeota archaeon]
MGDLIQNGDKVLIVYDEKRRWIVQVKEGESFHTNKGIIQFDDLIDKPYGTQIQSSKGRNFSIFSPTPADFLFKVIRKTQIVYPKDAAFILINTGIGPGSRVVEAGSGSGGLCSILAYYVRPSGKIYSYELREDFYKKAQKTITRLGLEEFVEFKNKDITAGIDEQNIDVIVLDLPTPWDVIPCTREPLKAGGILSAFLPTINQVQSTVNSLKTFHFGDVMVYELLLRSWQITSRNKDFLATRPQTPMVGHTGFIIFARKLSHSK